MNRKPPKASFRKLVATSCAMIVLCTQMRASYTLKLQLTLTWPWKFHFQIDST